MSTTNTIDPKRGDIWQVNLDPTIGAEIEKIRPCVVLSSDSIRKLPLRLVVPITAWKIHFKDDFWHVQINPDIANGIKKISAVDTLQLRCVSVKRFNNYLKVAHK